MDAVKFLKEEDRMCDKYKYSSDHTCSDCPCHSKLNGTDEICISLRKTDPAKYVDIVERWSAEHPIKTRQSEFLKMFPNTKVSNGVISICPKHIDSECGANCNEDCTKCRQNYWFAEIE